MGDTWSYVSGKGDKGYIKTKCLARFRSLNAMKYPVPRRTVNAGIITFTQETRITGGKFGGLTAKGGTMVCVTEANEKNYRLAVWRGTGKLDRSRGDYWAFTPWEEAQPGDLIGGFTTYYNAKTGAPRAKERAYNISLACQRIHNDVIKPGKTYSFNRHCGPYSQGGKYQLAPNISQKGVGYGGGVCQVSTTLYNAVLGLPLQVDAVQVHRKSGVNYIPQWFDSAVGPFSDLKFTNLLHYPIRLWAQPQGGALTVLIYRAEESDPA